MVKGLGIDAVDVTRFRRLLERRPSLRSRIFTVDELASLEGKSDDAPSLAVRFAAREATMKVLGVGLGAFDFHDVSVSRAASGAPRLVVGGRAHDLARAAGIRDWYVSLTHTDTMATAVVVAE